MACDRKIGPFSCCSVVQGDCLELMKLLPLVCECGADVSGEGGIFHAVGGHKNRYTIDAVITDPPYGMNLNTDYHGIDRGRGKVYPRVHGDDKPFAPSPWLRFPIVIIWGAQYFATSLPENGGWLVFNKRGDGEPSKICFGDCELAWTNLKRQSVRMHSELWHGTARVQQGTFHPTQKSIRLMEWCIEQAGLPETILDPYCGSGTTLVAAKKLGRHFLGFEISPEYCEIARKRIAAVEAQPTLFEKKPEQQDLGL